MRHLRFAVPVAVVLFSSVTAHANYQRVGAVGCTRSGVMSSNWQPAVLVSAGTAYCPFTDDYYLPHAIVNGLYADFYLTNTTTFGAASACVADRGDGLIISCDTGTTVQGTGWHSAALAHTSWTNFGDWYAYVVVYANDANASYAGFFATQ